MCFDGVLGDCAKMVREYEQFFSELSRKCEVACDLCAVAMESAFCFGAESLDAMRLLFRGGDFGLQAAMICRGFYELSTRLLWASREKHGWQRLQIYWAEEDRRFLKPLKNVEIFRKNVEAQLKELERVINQDDERGERLVRAPSVWETIQDIKNMDAQDDVDFTDSEFHRQEHVIAWKSLCRAVHAHPSWIHGMRREVKFDQQVVQAAVLGTRNLLRAFCHELHEDHAEKELPVVERRIAELWGRLKSLAEDPD